MAGFQHLSRETTASIASMSPLCLRKGVERGGWQYDRPLILPRQEQEGARPGEGLPSRHHEQSTTMWVWIPTEAGQTRPESAAACVGMSDIPYKASRASLPIGGIWDQ